MNIDHDSLVFDERGLIPVVVQDWISSEVLMVAYSDRKALEMSEQTGYMHFFSRSRQKLWKKGESSGNVMEIMEIRSDCDNDSILAKVRINGPSCHTGERSCFFKSIFGEETPSLSFIKELEAYLRERIQSDPDRSYTASLNQKGLAEISKKIGEEGVESALAIASGNKGNSVYEIADLVYHLLVGMIVSDINIEDIILELRNRHKSE
jgi:phosphoribosyl-ATP pyrophosphohydrolase/phosphoribosyl-AMP cyclohydrolase